jgi:hypothetical protein
MEFRELVYRQQPCLQPSHISHTRAKNKELIELKPYFDNPLAESMLPQNLNKYFMISSSKSTD